MVNLEWSPEDVEEFKRYAAERGATILKIEGPDMRGDYIFHIHHKDKNPPNLTQEFERVRHGKK